MDAPLGGASLRLRTTAVTVFAAMSKRHEMNVMRFCSLDISRVSCKCSKFAGYFWRPAEYYCNCAILTKN